MNNAYCVKKLIGKGSYGEVFLVTDGKKKYVIKKIKLTSNSAKERSAAEQEASLLSRLQHPNIVSYRESFQDENGVLHIVMGYCEGGDLCSRLKSYGTSLLSETQVVEWFVQIALGLQYLHDRNILHRDLKTQNIFLSRNNIIKVGDLGIAKVLDGSCDLAHTIVGTPYYMSPELFSDMPYNHKSDVWALGCCVHEIASLKHAFSARSLNALMYKIVQGKIPRIPSQYSPELAQLVQQMMARSADDRPSIHQVLRLAFVRKHIKLFLERASSRKKKNKPPVAEEPESVPLKNEAARTPSESPVQYSSVPPPSCEPQNVHPLPPDPSGLQTSQACAISSARQRRRKLKQEGLVPKSSGAALETSCATLLEINLKAQAEDPDKVDGSAAHQNHASDEVEEFFSLLNSTLHLPDVEAEIGVSASSANGGKEVSLASGRLAERIKALRLECENGLGVSRVHQAVQLLGRADPEEAEEELKLILGVKDFELFAAKLQQLKLCEDSLIP